MPAGVLLGLLFVVAGPSWAQPNAPSCGPDTVAALRALPAVQAADAGETVDATCKRWPYNDTIELATAVFDTSVVSGGDRTLLWAVAMLDASDRAVLASHVQMLGEDALLVVSDGALRLDTARYDLTPDIRAIGVSLTSSARGPSCPDGAFNEQSTLFVREGDRLRPVLDFYRDQWQLLQGSSCGAPDDVIVSEGGTLTVGVEPGRQHGFQDLSLTAHLVREASDASGEETSQEFRKRHVLRYDGKAYSLDPYATLFFWNTTP